MSVRWPWVHICNRSNKDILVFHWYKILSASPVDTRRSVTIHPGETPTRLVTSHSDVRPCWIQWITQYKCIEWTVSQTLLPHPATTCYDIPRYATLCGLIHKWYPGPGLFKSSMATYLNPSICSVHGHLYQSFALSPVVTIFSKYS